ncbi:MAG TPA: hypothetical protein VEW05_01945, partial [Candidatus Polarisedimenticolia bacterium]|nr:hypothetical protein [Candidatus Polarisedimenticolia bacterium]
HIAFGKGESPACRNLYGVPFLLAECISEVARGTAGAAAVARLGACYQEPGMRQVARRFGKNALMFGDEFRRYIETDLMKREPHADAKPIGAFSIGQSAT